MRIVRVFSLARLFALSTLLSLGGQALAQTDPLPSWNDGPAKKAILEFVQATTTQGESEVRARRASASPPSTRTARCGSSTRCTRR